MKLDLKRVLSYLIIALGAGFLAVAVSLFLHVSVDLVTIFLTFALTLIAELVVAYFSATHLERKRLHIQLEAEKAGLRDLLSETETKLLHELYNCVNGVVGEFIMYPELYAIGKKLDLSKDDLYRYSISLGDRGFLEVQPVLGGEIAYVKLAANGANFVAKTRNLK